MLHESFSPIHLTEFESHSEMDSFPMHEFNLSNRAVQKSTLMVKNWGFLEQESRNIRRDTILPPPFDYVGEPYADIIDTVASVLILKFRTEAFLFVKSLFYKRQTQSLAVQYIFDRFLQIRLSSFFSFPKGYIHRVNTACKIKLSLANSWVYLFY